MRLQEQVLHIFALSGYNFSHTTDRLSNRSKPKAKLTNLQRILLWAPGDHNIIHGEFSGTYHSRWRASEKCTVQGYGTIVPLIFSVTYFNPLLSISGCERPAAMYSCSCNHSGISYPIPTLRYLHHQTFSPTPTSLASSPLFPQTSTSSHPPP